MRASWEAAARLSYTYMLCPLTTEPHQSEDVENTSREGSFFLVRERCRALSSHRVDIRTSYAALLTMRGMAARYRRQVLRTPQALWTASRCNELSQQVFGLSICPPLFVV